VIWKTCGLYGAVVAVALFCRPCPAANSSQTVSFAWDPDPTGLTAGYNIYYGTGSQSYTTKIDVGANTQVTLSGFQPQSTNFFVITAYDADGDESAPSPEISYVMPVALQLIAASATNPLNMLQFPVMNGHWYEVQASADLLSWATIIQTTVALSNGMTQCADAQSTALPKRYYRLILH
jgi:hypothetical protein